MALYTLAGTKVSIGTSAAVDFTGNNAAVLEDFAGDTYTLIAKTEVLNDFGDDATDSAFTGLNDARTQHLKGPSDGGMAEITCGDLPTDAGQVAVKAASAAMNQAEYNFKFEWKNGDVSYIRGPVMGWRRGLGAAAAVSKRVFRVANNYGEFIDPA